MSVSREIRRVEIEIKLLRREFEKYFSGANDLPPLDQENRLRAAINRLQSSARSSAHLFRVSSLEATFLSYRELYGRRLRMVEEGRGPRRPVLSKPKVPRPDDGVVVDGEVSETAALSLYQGLYGNSEAPPVGLPQFRRYLEEHFRQIQARTHCESVVFRLAEENGTHRLKAKAVRRETESPSGHHPKGTS